MITMFSGVTSAQDLNRSIYNIQEPEEAEPWKGVFVRSLRKVSGHVKLLIYFS